MTIGPETVAMVFTSDGPYPAILIAYHLYRLIGAVEYGISFDKWLRDWFPYLLICLN
jgi:hypothetical protein